MSEKKICKWYSVCPIKNFFERGKIERKWIDEFCMGDWYKCVRYIMEENGEFHSDYMLPDGKIDQSLKRGNKNGNI